jgi:hypothetical protein
VRSTPARKATSQIYLGCVFVSGPRGERPLKTWLNGVFTQLRAIPEGELGAWGQLPIKMGSPAAYILTMLYHGHCGKQHSNGRSPFDTCRSTALGKMGRPSTVRNDGSWRMRSARSDLRPLGELKCLIYLDAEVLHCRFAGTGACAALKCP